MKNQSISRRSALTGLGALTTTAIFPNVLKKVIKKNPMIVAPNFSYCLNTSTIMGHKLGLVKEIELAAKTGYDGIEIWINSIAQYQKEGGTLKELKKRIDDLGIQVEDAIGFAQWIVDNNDVRTAALEQAKKEMDWLSQLGCRRIAAPPAGATTKGGLDLDKAAERFRALMEIGTKMGVIPQLEIWGFSANLYKLSQVLYVAAECGHPQTRILPDVYHLYKGGSDLDGLNLLNHEVVEIFHLNDYPDMKRAEINDKDRVYTGDGVAPIWSILKNINASNSPTVLSLELFNRTYWEHDVALVAKTGLEKMKESVRQAFE